MVFDPLVVASLTTKVVFTNFLIAPAGSLCTACRHQRNNNKQMRKIVRFFLGFPGVPGMGRRL